MKRSLLGFLGVFLLSGVPTSADISDYLLPNGDPIVGVYYYAWYGGDRGAHGGEPYRRVGWTPEFQYDNRRNEPQIYEVIKAMTDYGVNQASFSYWDNRFYLDCMERHLNHAEKLLELGRPCYFSPYMEPNTVNKVFASPEAQASNTDFISTFLKACGKRPAFCSLGGVPFTNIYVTYYRPDETDEDFRAFLRAKYKTIDALRGQWTRQPGYESQMAKMPRADIDFEDISLGMAEPGTVAFADRQELRAQRLKDGWGKVIAGVKQQTGLDSRYTGDVGRTIVSPTNYMDALTGMSWYSFGYALTNPTRRPKLISEVAKYTDTTFLYTISPGYVDRQQRWTGGRVERDPFLYPYAWVKALQTLPEGIMILTHSEWFEGSIIDVTKEYGKRQYETTELYSSIFRNAFESIYEEKREKKPIAIVFNEWATYSLNEGGKNLDDIYGLIKLLECLNLEYDVIPESFLSPEELKGRRLILVPNCGASLAPGHNELLLAWARKSPNVTLVVDESPWWAKALGTASGSAGRGVVIYPGSLGGDISTAFEAAAEEGKAPVTECAAFLDLLRQERPELLAAVPPPPSDTFEIKAGPVLSIGDTRILPAGNVIPWGYIAEHRGVGWGLGKGHSAEDTKPWERLNCRFEVPVQAGRPVAEVMAVDSDSGRFADVPFELRDRRVAFEYPMKFHALFAVVQSPVKLTTPQMTISPGQSKAFSIRAANVTRQSRECALRLKETPGLTMEAVPFTLTPGARADVPITLVAGTDYASGDRTIIFELEAGGRVANFWRPIHCTLPACIGTRTTILGGVAGTNGPRQVTLVNVGEAPATDVRLKLLDGEIAAPDLNPGDQEAVEISFAIPTIARSDKVPDQTVSLTLGKSKVSRGLTTRSGGDGTFQDLVVGGRPATVPVPDEAQRVRNTMIYLWVDDNILPPGDYDLEAVVDYFDQSAGSFMIEYDSVQGDTIEDRYKDSRAVSLLDTKMWRTAVIPLTGARLAGRQNDNADLRINGIVPVGKITLRGLRTAERRLRETMTVSYRQFGHEMTQDLEMSVISLTAGSLKPRPQGPPIWTLNPYGAAVASYSNGAPSALGELREPEMRTVDRLAHDGLLVIENRYLSAVWDKRRGGLVSLYCKATKTDYAAFPGPTAPAHLVTADGEQQYLAGSQVQVVDGAVIAAPVGAGDLEIVDKWIVAPGEPKITLDRKITAEAELKLADFSPVVLRLDPQHFSEVLPLGVGFRKEAQPKRGWLETWYSDGWYFAFSGAPTHAGHGLAVIVRPHKTNGRTGLTRFRYGFFPGADLPPPPTGGVAQDELQLRLRGHKNMRAGDEVHVTVDIYLLPGASYRTARQLALLNATPNEIRQRCTVVGDNWAKLGGVQTITPTAPTYMFPVRQPYYSASLEGDEQ